MSYIGIISGLGAGLLYGLSGFWKNREAQDFDWLQFTLSVIPAAIIGGIAGFMNMPYEVLSAGTLGLTVTAIAKNFISGLFKKNGKK